MSQISLYLPVQPFVREWLVFHYGAEPITFPSQSVENATIRCFLQQKPKDSLPERQQEGDIAILIPESKAKPTLRFNHVSRAGKAAVCEIINDNFNRCLWNELWSLEQSFDTEGRRFPLLMQIRAWCEMHGISKSHDYTIKQRYYRMKQCYLRHGIDYMKKKRVYGEK